MIQRYKVSAVNAQTAMTPDNDGEYVRWDDIKSLLPRKELCSARHALSGDKHYAVPCYVHRDCCLCDQYQEVTYG